MATSSFKEDVIVRSPEKSKEILLSMKTRDKTIKPIKSFPVLPKNASEIWFKRLTK